MKKLESLYDGGTYCLIPNRIKQNWSVILSAINVYRLGSVLSKFIKSFLFTIFLKFLDDADLRSNSYLKVNFSKIPFFSLSLAKW